MIVAAVYASIAAAQLSIRELRKCFDSAEPRLANPFDAIPGASIRPLGNLAAHVPPIAIGATWVWSLITSPT